MSSCDLNDIIGSMTNDEKLVLKKLSVFEGNPSVIELESDGLSSVAINRAALGLESKGLIVINDTHSERLSITKGGRALMSMIPEREVCKRILATGKTDGFLDDLGLDKNVTGIAIGWLRKSGWAEIKKIDGRLKVSLTDKCLKEMEDESWIKIALEKIVADVVHSNEMPKDEIKILRSRKAIELKEEKNRYLELTSLGSDVVKEELVIRKEVSQVTPDLLRGGKWREVEFKKFDVSLPVRRIYSGKKQPYLAFLDELKTEFVSLGFQEMRGPLIETEFWNFDALFQPQNHPARDWTDTYRLIRPKKGKLPHKNSVDAVKDSHEASWRYSWDPEKAMNLMPRAHGTCLSARQLYLGVEAPGKYFSVARCFRPDVLDKTHLIEFNQIEGIICDTTLTFKNLLGVLKQFATEIAEANEVRFYPDYYPFTEPSVQISAKHPELGWVEFGGAGIFRKELTQPLGVDIPVIAWGLGVDRLAMFKLGIDDIRFLFSDDISWLRDEEML